MNAHHSSVGGTQENKINLGHPHDAHAWALQGGGSRSHKRPCCQEQQQVAFPVQHEKHEQHNV